MKNIDAIYGHNPWNISYANIREKERKHSASLAELGYKVIRVYSCEFSKLKKNFSIENFQKLTKSKFKPTITFQDFLDNYYQKRDLKEMNIRHCVKGGRTEVTMDRVRF